MRFDYLSPPIQEQQLSLKFTSCLAPSLTKTELRFEWFGDFNFHGHRSNHFTGFQLTVSSTHEAVLKNKITIKAFWSHSPGLNLCDSRDDTVQSPP